MTKAQDIRSVLIFGGAGFVGSNLAHHLLTGTDAKVHIFDNLSRPGVSHNLDWLRRIAPNSRRLRVTIGDTRDRDLVSRAVVQATEIYHLAAQVAVTTSIADPRLDFDVNLGGTFNILDAARRSGHQPFILFTSTNKVYGDLGFGPPVLTKTRYTYSGHQGVSESQPLDFHSPYGCSKGAADQYVHDFARIYHLPTVVFRMSCIAGPRQFGTEDQGWVAHFLYSALQQQSVVIYGDGRQVRDVLCVYDLIRAIEAVRNNLHTTQGEIYNVGGGLANSISLLDLIREIDKLTGHQLEYVREECRPADQPVYITDYSKIYRHAGWQPQIDIEQTLELLREFWEENRDSIANRFGTSAAAFAMASEFSGRAG
ncbi:MAG TPA: GDP-mannose 4,6-dehydratase [Candidatus Angelobacter sp.]|nr:GDP-mannose 4,6-dehydratase [Candidatus Angelobacter sp.]